MTLSLGCDNISSLGSNGVPARNRSRHASSAARDGGGSGEGSPRQERRGEEEIRSVPSRDGPTSGPFLAPRSRDRGCEGRRGGGKSRRGRGSRGRPDRRACARTARGRPRRRVDDGTRPGRGEGRSAARPACGDARGKRARGGPARSRQEKSIPTICTGPASVITSRASSTSRSMPFFASARATRARAPRDRGCRGTRRPCPRIAFSGARASTQQIGIALRLHREKVAGEKDQVGLRRHGALGDLPEARDRHERTEVRIGDLHDAERPRRPDASPRGWGPSGARASPAAPETTRSSASRFVVSDWSDSDRAPRRYGIQSPRMEPEPRPRAPMAARARSPPRRTPRASSRGARYGNDRMRGRESARKFT